MAIKKDLNSDARRAVLAIKFAKAGRRTGEVVSADEQDAIFEHDRHVVLGIRNLESCDRCRNPDKYKVPEHECTCGICG